MSTTNCHLCNCKCTFWKSYFGHVVMWSFLKIVLSLMINDYSWKWHAIQSADFRNLLFVVAKTKKILSLLSSHLAISIYLAIYLKLSISAIFIKRQKDHNKLFFVARGSLLIFYKKIKIELIFINFYRNCSNWKA